MPDLEAQLTELAGYIEWPVMGKIQIARRRNPRWLYAAAAVLVIVATLVAYTPTREAIAGWVNLHTTIHRVQNPPTHPIATNLALGTETTMQAAQGQVAWKIVVPASLGAPDRVYVNLPPGGPTGGEVSLLYGSRAGIRPAGTTGVSVLITEARGTVNEQFFGKTLGPGVTIEQVSVDGHVGWWISGQPHGFAFTDAEGNFYFDTLRLATNTLIFDYGSTIVRIEGDMTQTQALQIARSMS